MSVWDWVGTVAMIWLAVSILAAGLWALAGRRIFRKPPMAVPYADFVREQEQRRECPWCRELAAEMRGRS